MIRSTLVALALLGAPAIVVAQQQSPMQGQAPAADTSKAKPAAKGAKKGAKKSGTKKHKPAAKPDSAAKP
ncbi:MAG TPA: hypothetical protein VM736_05350 [Gemmatimonadales bacterium]|nr:hypothetical protein [Gemmatimonadales bacterium]